IRDAIYRGREDFVYRISVSEQPFITKMFPLGGCAGSPAIVTISGWNLPGERVTLDTRAGRGHIRETAWRKGSLLANRLPYAVDTLPECAEAETNDTTQTAQNIALPVILNGRIGHAGDIDVFAFHARTGERVVAEVRARRLFSPLDSLVRLTDASGRVLAWNDDFEDKGMGLDTHHADSYISTNLPATGMYFIHVADSQHHGGDAYAYRLRISPPRPGFELRMAPSSINAAAGRAVPISVFAMRKDGFDGGIDIVLTNAPDGFTLSGARIPPGRDSVRMTLMAPGGATSGVTRLELEGCARIGSETVSAPVVPAEDMMQAFAYRHLVPSEQLLVCVTRGGRPGGPPIEVASAMPVRIPVGGAASVQLKAPRAPLPRGLQFELSDPPKGVALSNVVTATGAASFMLLVETNTVPAGYADNLIVEAFYDGDARRPGARPQRQRQRTPASILPAIPIEIIRRQ
ncbi:hypothetical protein GX586_04825, partial [bacterium]|nr:hypothetical protein [bacterium]